MRCSSIYPEEDGVVAEELGEEAELDPIDIDDSDKEAESNEDEDLALIS